MLWTFKIHAESFLLSTSSIPGGTTKALAIIREGFLFYMLWTFKIHAESFLLSTRSVPGGTTKAPNSSGNYFFSSF
jgi:hypothetical protein